MLNLLPHIFLKIFLLPASRPDLAPTLVPASATIHISTTPDPDRASIHISVPTPDPDRASIHISTPPHVPDPTT